MVAAHPAVRRATEQDAESITHILSRSFYLDPPLMWILPDDGERPRLSRAFFRPIVDMVLADGIGYINEDRTAASLWMDVDVTSPPPDDGGMFRKLMEEALGQAAANRFSILDDMFNEGHPDHASHAYLMFAGVIPERQSQGLGSHLITAHLANLDASGRPAYLEASSIRNERLYRRLGFAPIGTPVELPAGPRLVRMWREPAAAQSGTQPTPTV